MNKTTRQDPVTGIRRQKLGPVLFGSIPFFGFFAFVSIVSPYYSQVYLYLSLLFSIIGVISLVWANIKPNLWAKFLFYVSLSSIFATIAIRTFSFVFPSIKIATTIVVILTIATAHSLPAWNLRVAQLLRGELSYAPKSLLGKLMLKISLAVFPVAGFLGAILGLFLNSGNKELDMRILILAPLCWYLAILLPFSTHYPSSPWESTKKNLRTD